MSTADDIITALVADANAAISGLTTTDAAAPVGPESVQPEDLPKLVLLATAYEESPIVEGNWGQWNGVWTISGALYHDRGTDPSDAALATAREALQTDLEAFRDQVHADETLGGVVDRSSFGSMVAQAHPDERILVGVWAVSAEKVI